MDARGYQSHRRRRDPSLKAYVRQSLDGLKQQIDTMTLKEGPAGPAGRDGRDGKDGKDGAPGVAGLNGKDGVDGMGFEDLDLEHDGERTVTFTWKKGDRVKSCPITFPVTIYRGVYDATKGYERGDQVTWGGNTWTAKATTTEQPGFAKQSSSWQLTCKAGRDGKAAGKDPK